jgi:hypothetical protein
MLAIKSFRELQSHTSFIRMRNVVCDDIFLHLSNSIPNHAYIQKSSSVIILSQKHTMTLEEQSALSKGFSFSSAQKQVYDLSTAQAVEAVAQRKVGNIGRRSVQFSRQQKW